MMKRIILVILFLVITAAALYSCLHDTVPAITMVNFAPPENAELIVRDIRARGFTLEWTEATGNDYEYAIVVNDNIVLGFTPGFMLNGTHRVTGLLAGQTYHITLLVRAENVHAAEYLTADVTLPHIGIATFANVWINGREAGFNPMTDTFSYYYFPNMEPGEFILTYRLMPGCVLYINGERVEQTEIRLEPYEALEVTVLHERTQVAQDYIIYAGSRNNGIPIVIIDTEDNRRIRDRETNVPARMQIIDPTGYNPLGLGLYVGPIEIRGRGNSSWGMPKQSWNIFLPDRTPLFGMAPGRAWALIANYADKSLMRNYIAYEFARDLGTAMSPRSQFVDVILNGDFMGNYMLVERIRVGEGRLNFPRIRADTVCEYELTGTFVLEICHPDRLRGRLTDTFTSTIITRRRNQQQWAIDRWGVAMGEIVKIRVPSARDLPRAAFEYIRDYFNAAEDALFGDNFTCPDTGWRNYLDSASFVDWYLIHEFFKDVDGNFRLSTFLHKPRGGKLYMGPVWDFDIAAGNAYYAGGDNPEGWYVRTAPWFRRLFEDESFEQEFKDRWNYLMANGYFDRFFQRIDDTAAKLERSAEMNFQRWQILGRWVWPNVAGYQNRTTYQCEVNQLKDWMTRRLEWMDREINR